MLSLIPALYFATLPKKLRRRVLFLGLRVTSFYSSLIGMTIGSVGVCLGFLKQSCRWCRVRFPLLALARL